MLVAPVLYLLLFSYSITVGQQCTDGSTPKPTGNKCVQVYITKFNKVSQLV